MNHIVLVGDSIFDNGRYTEGGPDVVTQVRQCLSGDGSASLVAVDGATAADVPGQVQKIPADASHLVLSIGGNDAIMNAEILQMPAESAPTVLNALADASKRFEESYRRAVEACSRLRVPLATRTIYNGCFPDAAYQRLISTALMVFNDVILRVAIESQLTVLDLRFICSSVNDYANPIEPSSIGGAKIAQCIVNWATNRSSSGPSANVRIS